MSAQEQTSKWISCGQEEEQEGGQGRRPRRFRLYHLPAAASGAHCVVFVPGFMSHGKGLKATHLLGRCRALGCEYVCYDPEGLGESSGRSPEEAAEILSGLEFRHWVENCELALAEARARRVFLVGSSMGGMIALKMALRHPDRISGLLLIAPAVNTLRRKFDQWREELFDDEANRRLDRGEVHVFDSDYGPMPVRKAFFDNLAEEELDLSRPLPVRCPVSILHGVRDESVPHTLSLEIMERLEAERVDLVRNLKIFPPVLPRVTVM